MMTDLVWFVAGMAVGAALGLLVAGLLMAAARGDDR